MQENAGLRPALEMQMQAFGLRLGLNGECAFASLVLWDANGHRLDEREDGGAC